MDPRQDIDFSWKEAYRRAGQYLASLSSEEAVEAVWHNDFHEAPNCDNFTTKQVLMDLYRRIAELEKKFK